jgi:hypothetical protein
MAAVGRRIPTIGVAVVGSEIAYWLAAACGWVEIHSALLTIRYRSRQR